MFGQFHDNVIVLIFHIKMYAKQKLFIYKFNQLYNSMRKEYFQQFTQKMS